MATHYDDEAELENLKAWWKDNWLALAGGIAIGLAAIFGWEGYKSYETRKAMEASQVFEDMKKAFDANKTDEGEGLGERIVKEYAGTPYATSAALRLAANDVEHNKLDTASSRLQWVITNTDDRALKQLARLRQSRVLWQQGKTDDALKLLDTDLGGNAAAGDELRGDIKLSQGDRAAARAAYQKAFDAAGEKSPNRTTLQRKLDDLADVAVAS